MQLFALDYDTQIGTFFYKFSGSTATLVGCTNLNYWNSAYELPYEGGNGTYKTADVVIPEKVTYNSKEYTVTVIGNDALSYSTSRGYIHSIVLPNTITSIGENAFAWQHYCVSINIPSNLTYISNYAFAGLGVTNITIPQSVTYIGKNAFRECRSLSSY